MRAVLQRVTRASVTVGGEIVGQVGRGLCVLVGIHANDTHKDVEYVVNKILNLRLWPNPDDGKPWARSVVDIEGGVLCVSQFTLYSVTTKGAKPDFHLAMKSAESEAMYSDFLAKMRASYVPERIQNGRFGAMMDVSINNDGPVTIIIESPQQARGDVPADPKSPAAQVKRDIDAAKAARRAKYEKGAGPAEPPNGTVAAGAEGDSAAAKE
ncbi:D-tyrosyl-tRNA deacylase 1 [Hyaloraphidium curvatum]|nr:D-tyrosyl-tRNA deacylase 1 [Hyaloraphidium curvatum]